MKTSDESILARWLDGQLNASEASEFEQRLQDDAELRAEAESLKKLSLVFQQHAQLERALPNADFFNYQIQQSIAQERSTSTAVSATSISSVKSWWKTLLSPWMLTGATAAIAALLWVQNQSPSRTGTQILSFYTPDPSVQASSYQHTEAQATVLILEGLKEIPHERDIAAWQHQQDDTLMSHIAVVDEKGHSHLHLVPTLPSVHSMAQR